ncbi:MAG: GTPase ObgE [Candidatus Marinimicrobia bacterium]|nr:GTPase ObgE [Candidatus Neomarinimicrobiota bacterium]|tara:strand:+ start:5333 stop:6307 length:975 start_codon:yes stop_codon:yes gene_type:complete
MKFVDHVTIELKAGDGGNGCVAFLRERFRPKGGPSGGDGGHGGNIYIQATTNLSTLSDLIYNKHYKANRGENGKGKNMHGKNGDDIFISVPTGTIIKDFDTKQVIVDLVDNGEKILIAKGGNGGFGNARFKTQKIVAPRTANEGKKGEGKKIELELKVLADVGLVGFPNAGKSTFIKTISNAKPKIADYPFTTLTPNLGIVRYADYKTFVIADIPGLIKGASKGKGLGNIFLKHIERTKVLVYMIDLNDDSYNESFNVLFDELKSHDKELVKKPSLILLTKSDSLTVEDLDIEKSLKGISVASISSISKQGVKDAILMIVDLIK